MRKVDVQPAPRIRRSTCDDLVTCWCETWESGSEGKRSYHFGRWQRNVKVLTLSTKYG
jgi:phage baseplate assembly protein gpV